MMMDDDDVEKADADDDVDHFDDDDHEDELILVIFCQSHICNGSSAQKLCQPPLHPLY